MHQIGVLFQSSLIFSFKPMCYNFLTLLCYLFSLHCFANPYHLYIPLSMLWFLYYSFLFSFLIIVVFFFVEFMFMKWTLKYFIGSTLEFSYFVCVWNTKNLKSSTYWSILLVVHIIVFFSTQYTIDKSTYLWLQQVIYEKTKRTYKSCSRFRNLSMEGLKEVIRNVC